MPEAVREAAGLPVVDSLATPRTETYVVLNLFEPRYFEDDSVVVAAEWLVFDGTGDGGSFWGEDWVYVLTCDPTCVRLRRHGPGHMN